MDCEAVRDRLVALAAGRLAAGERAEVQRHLDGCASCRRAAEAEAELSAALDRLPRVAAPGTLRRRLEQLVTGVADESRGPGVASDLDPARAHRAQAVPASTASGSRRPAPGETRRWAWMPPLVSAFAAAALVLVVMRTTRPDAPSRESAPDSLVGEALNDHLRVISSTHPLEIESGGIHQVKPWFTGRLEFAPRVAFSGDEDFPLLGGSVGYVRDRKAAVMVFKRRLHTITLLIFPPEGLDWPRAQARRVGRLAIVEEAARGFNVLLWRDGGLAYALVSDVSPRDLELLATRLNPE
ncbi:MAG TPA: zf-HC2 domain-containing protein [Polyangia bacterium]